MAYKQTPGRGDYSKTGHGLPSPFKQVDPELTKKYEEGRKLLEAQRKKNSTPSGMDVDKTTGTAVATGYEKVFEEPNAANAFTARIKDSKGKQIGMAKADSVGGNLVPGGGKAVEELRRKYEKEKAFTESTRAKNVEQYNATGGGTSPDKLSENQKKTLITLGKMNKVNNI